MVRIAAHGFRMEDAAMRERIGEEFFKRRGSHLKALKPLEERAYALAPLALSYDIARTQPRFFSEFTYTEMMGCMLITPQSSELAARVVQAAMDRGDQGSFDLDTISTMRDKYTLEPPETGPVERVVFLPGSNIFREMLCRETLTRVMHEHPDAMMKPHPMTNEETIRHLGRLFGYHRILEPKSSGAYYLDNCEHAYVTSATETGLYGVLLGKNVHNVGHIRHEARGSFHPFYRLIWKALTKQERTGTLLAALGAHGSGFIHPDDPEAEDKIKSFFNLAMTLREQHRDFVLEFDPPEYAAMVCGERNNDGPVRQGRERPEQPGHQIPSHSPGSPGGFQRILTSLRHRVGGNGPSRP